MLPTEFRHLLTFTALLLAAYVMNSVKGKSIGAMESRTIAYVVSGGQIILLSAVSGITIWLLAASARLAATSPAATAPAATPASGVVQQPRASAGAAAQARTESDDIRVSHASTQSSVCAGTLAGTCLQFLDLMRC